ncbi:MAG: ATP-binding protein [Pseudomonadota bacterium]
MALLAEPALPDLLPSHVLHLLVVEDDNDHFLLLDMQLAEEEPRMRLTRAHSLTEAQVLIEHQRFDLVLLDLGLPESRGIATVPAARAFIRDCPILVLTSDDDTILGRQAIHSGAADFVDKQSLNTAGLARRIVFAKERFDALRKVQQRNEMLHTLVAILGHDLKSPPRQIGILSDRIESALEPDARNAVATHLDAIRGRCAHLRDLIDATMAYARNGAAEAAPADVALSEVIDRVRSDLDPDTQGRIKLLRDATVTADPALLFHILRNLVANGLKYWRGQRSQVTITGDADRRQSRITISDTGIGIAPDMLDRVFEPTIRGVDAVEFSGTGFGLAIVKLLVELHGGQVSINSSSGQGTTVTLWLPRTAHTPV